MAMAPISYGMAVVKANVSISMLRPTWLGCIPVPDDNAWNVCESSDEVYINCREELVCKISQGEQIVEPKWKQKLVATDQHQEKTCQATLQVVDFEVEDHVVKMTPQGGRKRVMIQQVDGLFVKRPAFQALSKSSGRRCYSS